MIRKTPEGSEPLGDEIKIYQPEQLMPIIQLLGTNSAPSNKFYTSDSDDTSTGLAHPSRIYIEIDNVIAPILNKTETIKTVNDFLKAISKLYKVQLPISERKLKLLYKKWSPYSSQATWYLWRSLDPIPVNY